MTEGWRRRFRIPTILAAAPAVARSDRGLVAADLDGRSEQLYAWDVPSGSLRRLTDRARSTVHGWIDPAGRWVYYLDDESGNEFGHLVRVPFEGGAAQDVTPGLAPYTLRGMGFSRAGNRLVLNRVDAGGFQLTRIDLDADGIPGTPRLLRRDTAEAMDALLSADGTVAVTSSTGPAGGMRRYTLLALDAAGGEPVGELSGGVDDSVRPVTFSPLPGDTRVLATSDRSGFRRPLLWDPHRQERHDLALSQLAGEVVPMDWSADGARLLLCQLDRGAQRLYAYELATGALTRLDHPQGTVHSPLRLLSDMSGGDAWFGADGEVVSTFQNSVQPPVVGTLDARSGRPWRILLQVSEPPPARPWQPLAFRSSDGQEVRAWLAVPDGDGPFPTVLDVHGGPHWWRAETFDPESQAWLDHGFAFVSVNFRGSTTFGRAFAEQIWGDVGRLELEDMVAARQRLVERGVTRPDAVIVTGASYGGFLTLYALGRRPGLWAGGIAHVATTDWLMEYEDASDALKAAIAAWFAGPPSARREAYVASSPITYARDVTAPVLVFQARNDTRVPPRQMEAYQQRLRSLGKQIEVVWSDGGHDLPTASERIGGQERALRFARRILDLPVT